MKKTLVKKTLMNKKRLRKSKYKKPITFFFSFIKNQSNIFYIYKNVKITARYY